MIFLLKISEFKNFTIIFKFFKIIIKLIFYKINFAI